MSRYKIVQSIHINQSPTTVFDFTQDYSKRLAWDTFLKRAELIDGEIHPDVHVKAWCVSKYGIGMETEYVSFNRPKVTAIKMSRASLIFKEFAGSWTFNEVNPDMTNVVFVYSFTLRFPFSIFGTIIFKNLDSNVQDRLRDLKKYLE